MHPSPPIPSVFSSNIILIILFSNKQLINVKKHTPILQALFYVIHSTHFLTIHILINKMDQFKSNKTHHKPHFILHTIYYVSAPRCHLHSVHQKQIVVLQAVEAFIFIIRIKSPIMLKIQITNVN